MSGSVLPFGYADLDAARAEAVIHRLAEESGNVIFSRHAAKRMIERDITATDVFLTLRRGYVVHDSLRRGRKDEWTWKITRRAKGSREIGVMTIILGGKELFIETVEWEDLT